MFKLSKMPKKITMEVFRCGKQTDSSGNSKNWTEEDLDKIVSKFEKGGEDIPATIGHPESDTAPAYGWFKKVFRKGNTLFAELSDVVDEFGDMLKKKMFRNRSIALRPDFSLRHIAFLGAAAPAVKGLADFNFKATEDFSTFDFEEADDKGALKSILDSFRNLFSEMSEKLNSTEDQNMPTIEELNAKIDTMEKNFSEKQAAFEEEKKNFEKEKSEFAEKEKKFNEDLAAEKKRGDEAEAKIKTSEEDARNKEYTDFLDKEISEGRVLPANKDALLKTMQGLHGQEEIEFSEGNETKKISPLEVFKKQIQSGHEQVSFGESFTGGSAPKGAGDQLKKIANEFMEKDDKLTFGVAFRKAQEQNPELTKLYEKTGE